MRVETTLNGNLQDLFQEKIKIDGTTGYKLTRKIIYEYFNNINPDGKLEPIKDIKDFVQTGNFEEDVKTLTATIGIKDQHLKDALFEIETRSKTKNSVKKDGAFHEDNAIADIKSLFDGKPNFFELKYHFDHWYYAGLLANAIARRGIRMSKYASTVINAVDERYDAGHSKTELTNILHNYKVNGRKFGRK